MFLRWKEAKLIQNGIDQFFGPQPPDRHYSKGKNSGKNAFFCKSHKNVVIRVFWHAVFNSALKIELTPTVFKKNAKNEIKYLLSLFFIFLQLSLKVTSRIA